MFHITQLTPNSPDSPATWAIRPDASLRAKGYPDRDLAARTSEQALHLYTLENPPRRKQLSKN